MIRTEHEGRDNFQESPFMPQFAYLYGQSLLPPSFDHSNRLTIDEFRIKYPFRFGLWERSRDLTSPILGDSVKNRNLLKMANNLDQYDRVHYTGEKRILRDWQIAAFNKLSKCIEEGNEEASIEATMGAGKTRFFLTAAQAVDSPTVIVTSRKNLVEQVYQEAKEIDTEIEIGRFYGDIKEKDRKITVTTYESLPNLDPDQTSLLVLDEAHRARGQSRIPDIEQYRNAFILAVSATLGGSVEGEDRIARAINNRIHTLSIPEAVSEGYNCGFRCILAKVKADVAEVKTVNGEVLTEEQIAKVKEEKIIKESILPLYQELRKRHEERYQKMGLISPPFTTLAYTNFVDNGKLLADIFDDAGVPSLPLWGTMNRSSIDNAINQLRTGELALAANAQLFREGTDIRSARLILNTGDTKSLTSEMQRSGRGLRTDPTDPFKETIIVDVIYEDKDNSGQALFPDLVGAAHLRYLNSPNSGNNSGETSSTVDIDLSEIHVEGITVITDAVEVLNVAREVTKEQYSPVPVGAMIIGDVGYKGTLVDTLGRSGNWVRSNIELAIKEIEKDWEEKNVAHHQRTPLFGSHEDSGGNVRTFYYLPLIERLQKAAAEYSPAPKDAMVVGDNRTPGNLVGLLSKTEEWIKARIPKVVAEIEKEWEEQGIPIEERDLMFNKHISRTGRVQTYYYKPVIDRLMKLAQEHSQPPKGAMIIGESKDKATLVNLLQRSQLWVKQNIITVVAEIEKEWEEQGIPVDEREELFGEHPDERGRIQNYYYQPVIERLIKIVNEQTQPPKGAMYVGSKKTEGSLANIYQHEPGWVRTRINSVISEIHKEWRVHGVPIENQETLHGEHLNTKNQKTVFYYEPVIKRLEQLIENESLKDSE